MAGQRLAKSFLLRKSWEFDAVYREGKRLRGAGFTLICRPTTSGRSRLGISIHRGLRGAVKRNRIKRIVRESFRLEREQYPQSADIVFAVRPDFACSCPHDVSRAVSLHHGIS
ncbi:MAG: ribonuclease P protein component [Desulforhopalus sp.]|nr:ribonuclease P protein component [Desulforhopalus sp.]